MSKNIKIIIDSNVEKGEAMPKIIDYAMMQKTIIQNAFQVFLEKGYYQTKLSDIAQRSHMKRTTFYSYFKNKDAVFEETLLYLIDVIDEALQTCLHSKSTLSIEDAKKLHSIIEQRIGFKNLFRIFMELWLMVTRGEFTLSRDAQGKIKSYINSFSPYIGALKVMIKTGDLNQLELLHYSFLLALPKKFIFPDQATSDPLMPFLALYD